MNTTMELSTLGLEKEDDSVRGYTFVNLNRLLESSYNEYQLYINENELKLTKKEQKRLGFHFIASKIIEVCSYSDTKKWFYYKINESVENTLVKQLFSSLPTNITYGDTSFKQFLDDRDYSSFNSKDVSKVSYDKFSRFLHSNGLLNLVTKLHTNLNIKLSLLP
tara:strand:+ start:29 stop:520 length:492 start_codon:yes stop_codon:yes gene_type:complete